MPDQQFLIFVSFMSTFFSLINFKMPRSHAKMHLKNGPQKLNFVIAKAI